MKPYKAVIAFVLTFLSTLLAQIADKTSFSDLTPLQWLIVVVSSVVTSGGVYIVDNNPGAYTRK